MKNKSLTSLLLGMSLRTIIMACFESVTIYSHTDILAIKRANWRDRGYQWSSSFLQKCRKRKAEKIISIMLGYGVPSISEILAPIPQTVAEKIKIINKTSLPIVDDEMANNCAVATNGNIKRNDGTGITITIKEATSVGVGKS